jgi:hypothetical protein
MADVLDGLARLATVIFALWVLVAALAGWVAYRKDRNPLAWFLLALFIGPLAWLTIAAVGDYYHSPEREFEEDERRPRPNANPNPRPRRTNAPAPAPLRSAPAAGATWTVLTSNRSDLQTGALVRLDVHDSRLVLVTPTSTISFPVDGVDAKATEAGHWWLAQDGREVATLEPPSSSESIRLGGLLEMSRT